MKYIKDRFYKTPVRLAPRLELQLKTSSHVKSELLFLAGCECKGTTSFSNHQISGEVFFADRFLSAKSLYEVGL